MTEPAAPNVIRYIAERIFATFLAAIVAAIFLWRGWPLLSWSFASVLFGLSGIPTFLVRVARHTYKTNHQATKPDTK